MTAPADHDLGTFDVAADASDLRPFREAIGLSPDDPGVPLTFPIRWLALPAVRAALTGLVEEPDLVLIHESQTFDYERPLHVGEAYTLILAGHRDSSPDRLVASAKVVDADGALCVIIETVLRLFSTTAAVAA